MNIDVELIEKVVKKVLNDVETGHGNCFTGIYEKRKRIWIWYL